MNRRKVRGAEFLPVDISDRPSHPRVFEVALRSPDVFLEFRSRQLLEFGPRPKFINQLNKDVQKIEKLGRVLDLSTPGGVVYIHWIFDLLPKFKILVESGLDVSCFDLVVVNGLSKEFQRGTLDRFVPDGVDVLTLPRLRGNVFLCEEHVRVTPVRKNSSTPRWVLDFVEAAFPVDESTEVRSKKVYLSRRNASRRRVVNEEEVSGFLSRRGFHIVDCEKYSLPQIRKIMRHAEVVVGPHGAAMANIAFCKMGTRIVELYSSHLSQDYWLLCKRNALKYISLHCADGKLQWVDPFDLNYRENFSKINSDDIFVDLNALEGALNLTEVS